MIEDENKEGFEDSFDDEIDSFGEDMGDSSPSVAESGKKNVAVVILLVVAVAIVAMFLFGDDEQPKDVVGAKKKNPAGSVPAPAAGDLTNRDGSADVVDVGVQAPPPPPPPVAPPPPPIIAPSIATGGFGVSSGRNAPPVSRFGAPARPGGNMLPTFGSGRGGAKVRSQDMSARIKSSMTIIGGGADGGGYGDGSTDIINITGQSMGGGSYSSYMAGGGSESPVTGVSNPNRPRGQFEKTGASNVTMKEIGDPYSMIFQGKMINAVLETAINTDLPGLLRAVVSRDVYAEAGKRILIPKGSRLIGNYNSEISVGQARIYMTWERIITPDGFDMDVSSPATDVLGRAGLSGMVDTKYMEIFSNAILLSAVTVGFAAATEAITGSEGDVDQGETGSGDATTSGSVTDIATIEAVTNFGDTANNVVEGLIDVDPTVTVDQGTKLNIFVNRDMVFAPDPSRTGRR